MQYLWGNVILESEYLLTENKKSSKTIFWRFGSWTVNGRKTTATTTICYNHTSSCVQSSLKIALKVNDFVWLVPFSTYMRKQKNLIYITLTFISMVVLYQARFNILNGDGLLNDTKLTKQVLVSTISGDILRASYLAKNVSRNYKSGTFENITFFINTHAKKRFQ